MPQFSKALIRINDFNSNQIRILFEVAKKFKQSVQSGQSLEEIIDTREAALKNICLAFFEPSTRTRLSFATAASRLGIGYTEFIGNEASSMAKGESLAETLQTLIAMNPDLLVLRYAGDENIWPLFKGAGPHIVNAGDGTTEHPTQALLDVFTVLEKLKDIEGKKILYVGDVAHSRVAFSGRQLFHQLGALVGTCGPGIFAPKTPDWSDVQHFENLQEALSWADVCIGLRIQKERHVQSLELSYDKYRLSVSALKSLGSKGLIMHPGPFVAGVDLDEEVLLDERCAIREQVTNGVYTRMACLSLMLGLVR